MKYSTILWDLDGTIIDSSEGIFASFAHTFEVNGLEIPTLEEMRACVGPPLTATFARFANGDDELAQRLLNSYRQFYVDNKAGLKAKLFPGVVETIAAARAAGATNSLATSKALSGTQLVGEHFGFLDLFDFLGTASNDATRTSKIDVMTYALTCLGELGHDIENTVLVGDRIHDVEGARHHGVDVVLVKWGFGNEDEWAQADAAVSTPTELSEFLLG